MSKFNYDIIEAYVSGELTGDALSKFRQEMESNAELAKELALYQQINADLGKAVSNSEEEAKLRATLSTIGKSNTKQEGKLVPFSKKWIGLGIAAAVALIIVFKPWGNKEIDNNLLFANNFNSSIDSLSSGTRGSDADSLTSLITTAYNTKNYYSALELLKGLDSSKLTPSLLVAKAVSLIQTNEENIALPILQELEQGKSVYASKATWYKALVFLKQGKKDACVTALKSIPETADEYKNAATLLKELK